MKILVRYVGEKIHEIGAEISRWRDILAVPYKEYLLSQ